MAIAAAAPALSERVEPRWVMATSREQPATMAGVRPGPSEPKIRQVSRTRRQPSRGEAPGRLSTPPPRCPAPPAS